MNIVCSIDNGYVEHCCVMLCSFFVNNTSSEHAVYLLGDNLSTENQEIINNLVASYKGKFMYCQVESEALKDCPIGEIDHLTIATYYRLFVVKLLPESIDKVLYLDSDLVVNAPLDELWNTNLEKYALAAVDEMGWHYKDAHERLGFSKEYGYFNAGMILINLKNWREHNLTKCFTDFLSKNATKLKAHDQDVLNATLYDKCLHISFKWNVETGFCMYDFILSKDFNPSLLKALIHPKIIHYTWKPKPWEGHCKHPFRIVYYIYYNKLPIKKLFNRTASIEKLLRLHWYRFKFCLLLCFSIKKQQYYRI